MKWIEVKIKNKKGVVVINHLHEQKNRQLLEDICDISDIKKHHDNQSFPATQLQGVDRDLFWSFLSSVYCGQKTEK